MIKTASSSGAGTSAATQKVMTLLEDPDAALLAILQNGEVTLVDAPPFVRMYWLPSYAAMHCAAAPRFFVGETANAVRELRSYVERKLSFRLPAGALSLHPGYLHLTKLLAKVTSQRATVPVKEVYLAHGETGTM